MTRGRPHKCPYCEATTSVAKGFRYNKAGKVRLRRCKSCGRRWTAGAVHEEQKPDAGGGDQETMEMAEVPDDYTSEPAVDVPDQVEQGKEIAESDQETGEEPDRGIELSLSGEESPNHEDSGEERLEEAEDTFLQH